MFSQACVKNSVHMGEVYTPGQTPPPRADNPWQADTPSPKMATAADGTHPTGMHSCFIIFFLSLTKYRD